ncbi:MAG: Nramp family divalent metal transporter [Bacteroidetes bacterium]|nr:Nramp family divalent metal transporter [Bacteroidota bacterium]MDA1119463.1 Nramp family divalent metal transporter [Bacteroidota bacterium]
MSTTDPYVLSPDSIKDPPQTFRSRLKYLGPGFILSASIVGSGELIATTTLGAQAGFITFWVIIISCLVKVALQVEFAKYTILTGKTTMNIIDELPGPRFGKARWSVWAMFGFMIIKLLQLAGILGGVAIVLNIAIPGMSIAPWAFIIAISVSLLIYKGYYKPIENFSVIMIGFFTLFTFMSLHFVQYTPFAFTFEQILSGLQFRLPKEAAAVAIGAFGITGVGGDEIMYYNYWCLEKGYARYTGPREDSDDWRERSKGWIKTMYLDAIAAMIVYTVVTALFYLLGASVLYAQGKIPEGYEMIETISAIYTESLGPGAKIVYLGGAFLVLFSTLFASLAAWARLFPDIFGMLGWINFSDMAVRKRYLAIVAWTAPLLWASLFLFIKLPVILILSGGIVGSFILFVIVFSGIYIRYWKTESYFKAGLLYDMILWISIISIFSIGLYGLWQLFF